MALSRSRRTVLATGLGVFGALLVAWLIFVITVIGHPSVTERPQKADAIVVLGPSNKRVPEAVALARSLGMTELVLSIGDFPQQVGTCEQPGLVVTCFVPDPYETVGEAEEIGRLAVEHGWHSLIVMTSTPHIARARMLIERCYPGRLQMVRTSESLSWSEWLGQAFYQSGAFVKAVVNQPC